MPEPCQLNLRILKNNYKKTLGDICELVHLRFKAATHRTHGADLIQGQPQQPLVAALGHQLERRLLQAGGPVLEQQVRDVADALWRREGGRWGRGGEGNQTEMEKKRAEKKEREE